MIPKFRKSILINMIWCNNISSEITNLSNYFVISEGVDLFDKIFKAIDNAKKYKAI